jgi:hypothetical protein
MTTASARPGLADRRRCADPCRVHDFPERTGYPPSISFVMANILKKGVVLILGEVRPDAYIVLAGDEL